MILIFFPGTLPSIYRQFIYLFLFSKSFEKRKKAYNTLEMEYDLFEVSSETELT